MKKMMLSVLLVCGIGTCYTSYGQTNGDWWVGGNVSVWANKTDGLPNLVGTRILPEFGYQFHDNWGVGIQLGYVHDQQHSTAGDRLKSDGLYVSPFVRYSFLNGRVGNLFVDGVAGYGYNKYKTPGIKQHDFEVGFRPGVGVHVTDNISIIGKIGFLGYEYQKFDKVKSHSGGLQLDLDHIDVGVVIRF